MSDTCETCEARNDRHLVTCSVSNGPVIVTANKHSYEWEVRGECDGITRFYGSVTGDIDLVECIANHLRAALEEGGAA